MRLFSIKLDVLIIAATFLPAILSAQSDTTFNMDCQVNQVYPFISITRAQLADANTIADINSKFKPSWVKDYKSIVISAINNGKTVEAKAKDQNLTSAQKNIIQSADAGSVVKVRIKYLPDNNLSKNDVKESNFELSLDPVSTAAFPGGEDKMNSYFQEKILDKISKDIIEIYNLAAVKFTINELGQPIDVKVTHSTEDMKTDEMLYDAVCNMPIWTPAEYTAGQNIKQEFVLSVGDMRSCTSNLLGIRAAENRVN